MSRPAKPASIALLLSTLFAASAAAQEYSIKLHRPSKVGDSYAASMTIEMTSTIDAKLDGDPQPRIEEAEKSRLDGAITILAVGKPGRATKLSCAVERCMKDGQPLLDPATVVVIEYVEKDVRYTVKGEPVEAEVAAVLKQFFRPNKSDEQPDDDKLMGTDVPQKVGGTWGMNAELATKVLSDYGAPVKKDQVKGRCKLAGVKKVDGKDVLQIDADITLNNIAGPTADGMTVESGDFEMRGTTQIPADPAAGGSLEETMSVNSTMRVKGRSAGGKPVTADVKATIKSSRTFSNRKSAPPAP